ncbi:MAG TPA: hydroxyethylthiazole kinase, partial [Acinetobacter nosocomialis]|nr:hydroxyethylthiazole kinase [Acinetobacter nosocomialis]
MTSTSNLIEQVIEAWQNMQAKTPLVQCITNSVAANYTANVLLASGASPAMIDNPYEAESFTKISSALSINLGTPTSEQMQAMQISAKTAQLNEVPWVL